MLLNIKAKICWIKNTFLYIRIFKKKARAIFGIPELWEVGWDELGELLQVEVLLLPPLLLALPLIGVEVKVLQVGVAMLLQAGVGHEAAGVGWRPAAPSSGSLSNYELSSGVVAAFLCGLQWFAHLIFTFWGSTWSEKWKCCIFPIPCESVDAVTRLNCFEISRILPPNFWYRYRTGAMRL